MSGDAMKLVRFVCANRSHTDGRSDAALTIHEGAWAFCPSGSAAKDHQWQPSDGLPFSDAMRFTPRQPVPTAAPETTVRAPAATAPATAKSTARSR